MAQIRTSRTFDVIFLLALGAFLWWAIGHRTPIGDWVYFLNYTPGTETIGIADEAGLSDYGRRLFYRTDPQLAAQSVITQQCDSERLGCLTSKGQIFILDAADKHSQTVVTAAHEMLHLAYRRLSQAKKDELAPLIDQAITDNSSNGITDELRHDTNPDDRRDEAHSLLGTEYKKLPTELENYYSQYFTDRTTILTAYKDSEDEATP